MAYKFPLQRVLEVREDIAKECEIRMETLVQRLSRLRDLLMNERNSYLGERDELNESIKIGQLDSMKVYEGSLEMRKKRMMQVLEVIKSVEQERQLAEQDLIRAKRDVKVIEKYKDKKTNEYDKKVEESERKFFDEQATARYVRDARRESKN